MLRAFMYGAASALGEMAMSDIYVTVSDPFRRAVFLNNLRRTKKKVSKILRED